MKRIFSFLTVTLIVLLLSPVVVNASNVILDDDIYTLESVEPTCEGYTLSMPTSGNEKGMVLYMSDSNNDDDYLFWQGNNNCSLLSNQDLLTYYNRSRTFIEYDENDNKLYEYVFLDYTQSAFVRTEDLIAQDGKVYYQVQGGNHDIVYVSVGDDVTAYYERIFLSKPKSVNLENDVDYYTIENNMLTLVDNPKAEDIMNYYLLYNGYVSKKEINKFPLNEANEHIDDYFDTLTDVTKLSQSVQIISGKYYLVVYYNVTGDPNNKIVYFNEDYDVIEEFNNQAFDVYGDFIVRNEIYSNIYQIYDQNLNPLFTINEANENKILTVYESNDILLLTLSYQDYFIITKYKVLEGNKQTYNNTDLSIRINAFVNGLSKVKVNNVELSTEKYDKASGSTIITLKKEYLDTLEEGTYTLKAEYVDGGFVLAEFNIPEVALDNPQTSDEIMNSVILGGVSILGLLGTAMYLKKKKALN